MMKSPQNVCVSDGHLKWSPVPCADGYNVHLQGEYIDTVLGNKYRISNDRNWSVSAFFRDPEGRREPFHSRRIDAVTSQYVPSGNLLWSEDFTGFGSDQFKQRWTSEFDWGRNLVINNEDQHYVAQLEGQLIGYTPFAYMNGALNIKAVRQPYNGQSWLSGKLCTTDARQLEGEFYVGVVARCDFAKGIWPAIWLYTALYGSPQSEIDIFEQPGIDRFTAYHNYHFIDSNGMISNEQTSEIDTTEFHEYGCLREEGKITIMIDRMPVHTITENVILEPMNLILNLAMGGTFAGVIPEELNEANFYIKSVDVYSV